MDWLELVKQSGDGPLKTALLLAILHGVRELSKMRKSVERLNIGMASVIAKIGGHERRIRNLERKK